MKILVTGGAGFVGSVIVRLLQQEGVEVVVLDNLACGHQESVTCPVIIEDLLNKKQFTLALKNHEFNAVIHLAAYALPGESMLNPSKYFQNNLQGGLNLLEYMKEKSIPCIIHSSSCAIYGKSSKLPIEESSPKIPESVYGETKLMFETILSWYSKLYEIKHINLRYFNVAGATIDGLLGERHETETHIIPNAIKCAIQGTEFRLFGNKYKTHDGTCIRDYIHVEDLASAHLLALNSLTSGDDSNSYNLGSGFGHSNLEVINMIEDVSGFKLRLKYEPARAGDPPIVYADTSKVQKLLSFTPKYSDLRTIIETAYRWHRAF